MIVWREPKDHDNWNKNDLPILGAVAVNGPYMGALARIRIAENIRYLECEILTGSWSQIALVRNPDGQWIGSQVSYLINRAEDWLNHSAVICESNNRYT